MGLIDHDADSSNPRVLLPVARPVQKRALFLQWQRHHAARATDFRITLTRNSQRLDRGIEIDNAYREALNWIT